MPKVPINAHGCNQHYLDMNEASIILPHQLFKSSPLLAFEHTIFLVEEQLFFMQYKFHKQKLTFHRASMKFYANYLAQHQRKVIYIEAHNQLSDIRKLIKYLSEKKIDRLYLIDPTDNWLQKRIKKSADSCKLDVHWFENPLFLNSKEELQPFFKPTKKKFFQTSFYKNQRLQRNILMENGQPMGGKWTYDDENRKKYPKGKVPPAIEFPKENDFYLEARAYVAKYFPKNYGHLNQHPLYPTTFQESEDWLQQFLEHRFQEFGPYEDAIVQNESILNHSVLSPLLNIGLLTPEYVLLKITSYAKEKDIPVNSTEGLVRQIMGWREFIRGVYEVKGTEERTKNFWNHQRKIPASFYAGTTGIVPVDITIKKIMKTAYAHHIERLMLLGNFMVLCEFHPNDVYQWFMELFIDAYDWVMVPNVYGMSLFADGGIMSTKPYISSSNYVLKMSDFKKGSWQQIWDGLFWRFMDKHRDFFLSNPRLSMLIRTFNKMDKAKQLRHLQNAENFLESLDQCSKRKQ